MAENGARSSSQTRDVPVDSERADTGTAGTDRSKVRLLVAITS